MFFLKMMRKTFGETMLTEILNKGTKRDSAVDIAWLRTGLDQVIL